MPFVKQYASIKLFDRFLNSVEEAHSTDFSPLQVTKYSQQNIPHIPNMKNDILHIVKGREKVRVSYLNTPSKDKRFDTVFHIVIFRFPSSCVLELRVDICLKCLKQI